MKKSAYLLALSSLFFPLSLFSACTDDETDLGISLTDPLTQFDGIRDTLYADRAWSRLEDSMLTVNFTHGVIGNLNDGIFGRTTSELYTQVALPSSSFYLSGDIEKVVITLAKEQLFPDTAHTYSFHFEVCQLAEDYPPDTLIYSSRTLAVNESVVYCDSTLTVGPTDTLINLTLSPAFHNLIPRNGTAEEFLASMKGLRIRILPDSETGMMSINFSSPKTCMTIHYNDPSTGNSSTYTLLLGSGSARASGTWLTFDADGVPEERAWMVQEYTGTVRITFLGDCTLGGEEKARTLYRGFVRTIERNGCAWPFRNLAALTASDDLTVANLEGVLSDRTDLRKVEKTYNFIGSAAYTEILREGSVECVTLANNHSRDYGPDGYWDTVRALKDAGVAYFNTDSMAVWRNDEGLMIGFLGASVHMSGSRYQEHQRQAKLLRELGCAAVITVMHAGREYESEPGDYQRQIARRTVASGVNLVIGHHPHIVQGYEILNGTPVVYSLGNCVFGGNTNPRDHDALAVRADLSFEDGELSGMKLHFWPIAVSGEANFNDYSPVLLTGDDAERVLRKMEKSTGIYPDGFTAEQGAQVVVPAR